MMSSARTPTTDSADCLLPLPSPLPPSETTVLFIVGTFVWRGSYFGPCAYQSLRARSRNTQGLKEEPGERKTATKKERRVATGQGRADDPPISPVFGVPGYRIADPAPPIHDQAPTRPNNGRGQGGGGCRRGEGRVHFFQLAMKFDPKQQQQQNSKSKAPGDRNEIDAHR